MESQLITQDDADSRLESGLGTNRRITSSRSSWLIAASVGLWAGTFALTTFVFWHGDDSPGALSPRQLQKRTLRETLSAKHKWPEMYGKQPEKTIWQFWYHPENCPSSQQCSLPDVIRISMATVEGNKGSFAYKLLHMDELDKYLSRTDLPLNIMAWHTPAMKDSIMNALLFRYGGVALDASSVLLRPLDEHWDHMVQKNYTMFGYKYRASGIHWTNAECMAVWFIMSRKEGVFASTTRSQIITAGDITDAFDGAYHNPYFALGDQTLTPFVHMFQHDWWGCLADPAVTDSGLEPDLCPELEYPDEVYQLERNDAKLYLAEPRLGPQLPCTTNRDHGMWEVGSMDPVEVDDKDNAPVWVKQDCWATFIERWNNVDEEGMPVLPLAKMFDGGGPMKDLSEEEIFNSPNSYFMNWLSMSGLEVGK